LITRDWASADDARRVERITGREEEPRCGGVLCLRQTLAARRITRRWCSSCSKRVSWSRPGRRSSLFCESWGPSGGLETLHAHGWSAAREVGSGSEQGGDAGGASDGIETTVTISRDAVRGGADGAERRGRTAARLPVGGGLCVATETATWNGSATVHARQRRSVRMPGCRVRAPPRQTCRPSASHDAEWH